MNEDPNPDWCVRANKQKINIYSGASEKAKCSHKTKPINPTGKQQWKTESGAQHNRELRQTEALTTQTLMAEDTTEEQNTLKLNQVEETR